MRQLPTDPAAWAPVLRPGSWREVRVVASVDSTNAALAALADEGEAAGLVVVAEHQTAGRGRLDRTWTAPPGSGLTFSVLVRPPVAPASWGWLPLLTGLAVAEAVEELTAVRARVKWPNDVVVEDRKLAGVLAEVRPGVGSVLPAVVVGVGLNVALGRDELPVPTATSLGLELAGPAPDRAEVLRAVLAALAARYTSWIDADGDAEACGLRTAYTVRCATVGRRVRAELPRGVIEGEAVGVDLDGGLQLAGADGRVVVRAGDVVHLR